MATEVQTMMCPRCAGVELRSAMTRQGVEIDYCGSCGGIWLDKGEIFQFAHRPRLLAQALRDAQHGSSPGDLKSPKTGRPMLKLSLFGGKLELDFCRDTGGIWLDKGELDTLLSKSEAGLRLALDTGLQASPPPTVAADRLAALAAGAAPLPNLFVRSAGLLITLYALLGAILIALVEFTGLSPLGAVLIGAAVILLQFLISPFLMDLSLSWFYRCKWAHPGRDLPDHLREFVERVTRKRGMRFPRFGIIDDGAPNAFTYGHHPGNARIVITRGLFNLLDDREVEAVVAHEIGHAVHWDMLIMTMAYLVPLIAYYIFRTLIQIKTRGRDKSAGARMAIALASYVVYIIAQYLVLWLSRTREYHADRFAGEVTGNPNALASALVHIGYGLAGQARPKAEGKRETRQPVAAGSRAHSLEAIGALGIFDIRSARALAIASTRGSGMALSPENIKGAMAWELWNPWAKFYELNSTHPLIAHRLDHLGRQAAGLGHEPFVVFDLRKPECYWDDFLVDVGVMALPLLLPLVFLIAAAARGDGRMAVLAIAGLGLGMLAKTLFSYPRSFFPETNVAGLLKNIKVSGVRGVPCKVKGTVIGRGVPGLIWSEDFVIRDETGILFLDYRQPLRLIEFLFGLLRRGKLDNAAVEATGWYRRSPMPYVELNTLTTGGKTRRCYVYHVRLVLAVLLMGLGLYLRFAL